MKIGPARFALPVIAAACVGLSLAPVPLSAAPAIGEQAPAFTGTDTRGTTHALGDYHGKVVVLEWTNHECPYTVKHYDSGNMQALQKEATGDGAVWLSVISSAPGAQGHVSAEGADELTETRDAAPTAVLLDPSGDIGRLYGAKTTPHMYVIDRDGTPADLLGDLMGVVENRLREKIMDKFDKLEPGVLEAALAASQQRMKSRIREDKDIAEAQSFIRKKKIRKELNGQLLASLLREKKQAHFCVGFAEMAGVDYLAAKRALEHESPDGLALICKAAGIEKALFVSLAVLREGAQTNAFSKARDLGALYERVSRSEAERVLRFWRMRKDMAA